MKPTIEELEATLNLFKNAVKILDVKSDKPAVLSLNDCNAVCFALTQAIEKGESVIVQITPKISNYMKAQCMGEFYFAQEEPEIIETEKGFVVTGNTYLREFGVPWDVCKQIFKAMSKAAQEGAKDE